MYNCYSNGDNYDTKITDKDYKDYKVTAGLIVYVPGGTEVLDGTETSGLIYAGDGTLQMNGDKSLNSVTVDGVTVDGVTVDGVSVDALNGIFGTDDSQQQSTFHWRGSYLIAGHHNPYAYPMLMALYNLFIQTTITANNSAISVTFAEAVYGETGANGALTVTDFTLSISGGTVTVAETPSSISIVGNVYTLGLTLDEIPRNGSEMITVVLSSDTAIYYNKDDIVIDVSTTQSNNTVTLNDTTVPTITSTTVASDNSTISVTFSEAVFNATGGSGALEASDFALSI
jgi:hypothetical protein